MRLATPSVRRLNTGHNPHPSSKSAGRRWCRQAVGTGTACHRLSSACDTPEATCRIADAIDTGLLHTPAHGHYVIGSGGTGKSHLAQAIGQAAILQGHRVLYREAHVLLDELADAVADGTRKQFMSGLTVVPLLIIDDFGMRKLPLTAAEDLLEIVMRRYERASTLLTSNRPVEDWGKLLGDTAAVSSMLDRLLHHGHVLKCGPRSWRAKAAVQ